MRTNLLYFGGNLGWLRDQAAFSDESVDLVYLDPPQNVGPASVRELIGTVNADADAAFGVFICLHMPTKPMTEAALEAGTWVSDWGGAIYPRLQILSAQDLIDGKQPRMPGSKTALFAEAKRERSREGTQGRLG